MGFLVLLNTFFGSNSQFSVDRHPPLISMGSLQKSQKCMSAPRTIAEEAGMFIAIQLVRLVAHIKATKVEQTTKK
jgi:hypothetical protein